MLAEVEEKRLPGLKREAAVITLAQRASLVVGTSEIFK